MENKTAIQHLIEKLTGLNAFEMGIYIRDNKHRLLEMEKQQIIDAWESGNETGSSPVPMETSQSYYNETYGDTGFIGTD